MRGAWRRAQQRQIVEHEITVETASTEFGATSAKPSSAATMRRSVSKLTPASAPEPSGRRAAWRSAKRSVRDRDRASRSTRADDERGTRAARAAGACSRAAASRGAPRACEPAPTYRPSTRSARSATAARGNPPDSLSCLLTRHTADAGTTLPIPDAPEIKAAPQRRRWPGVCAGART